VHDRGVAGWNKSVLLSRVPIRIQVRGNLHGTKRGRLRSQNGRYSDQIAVTPRARSCRDAVMLWRETQGALPEPSGSGLFSHE
jgi:hypothetical protein